MTIQELAKELTMNSMELLEKVKAIGVKARAVADEITDEDAEKVRKKLKKKKKDAETKVVKVAPKKESEEIIFEFTNKLIDICIFFHS